MATCVVVFMWILFWASCFIVSFTGSKAPHGKVIIKKSSIDRNTRTYIVFVYYVSEDVCKYGAPEYIRDVLRQAQFTQPSSSIFFISNYMDCPISWSRTSIPDILFVDTSMIISTRSIIFKTMCLERFQRDRGELWMTSALRFFLLEDFMRFYSIRYLIHLEADNMLYINLESIQPVLTRDYNAIGITPLSRDGLFATASVMWIPSLLSLIEMNNVFRHILKQNHSKIVPQVSWKNYSDWLRGFPHACCKPNGVDPDEEGNGLKPFAINEMSMLAFYKYLLPEKLIYFPVLPSFNFSINEETGWNSSAFSPDGSEVGAALTGAIWDSGSWGQYLGGTAKKNGRNKRFTDPSHIIGYALRHEEQCTVVFDCILPSKASWFGITASQVNNSYTAPWVRCNATDPWTPIINLHIHSKRTDTFLSQFCKGAGLAVLLHILPLRM